jgi:hypothetical protein
MMSELNIEETKKFVEYGIIVFNENGKRCYYRPRKLSPLEVEREKTAYSDPLFELVPLTKDELVKYGIEETETHEVDDNHIIEESEQGEHELSTDEKLKKVREAEEKTRHTVIKMDDPESVRAAKELLTKQENKLGAQAIGNDVKEVLQAKFREKDVEPPRIESKEDYETAVKLLKALPEKHAPSGTARCDDPRQMGISQDLYTKKYEGATKEDSYKNMIEDLREQSHRGSKEAESYLTSLWEIALKPEIKENQHAYAPKTDEIETRTTPEGFKVSKDETELQRMFRKWREERLRKMGVSKEQTKGD